jgi:hypothetical protein
MILQQISGGIHDDTLVGEILSLFIRTLHYACLRLRVLITSRPQTQIESKMTELDTSSSANSKISDIRIFLTHSLAEIYRKRQKFMDDMHSKDVLPMKYSSDGLRYIFI